MDREDINIISRNSNWSTQNVAAVLKRDVYNDTIAWKKFLRLFFISLAIGFITAAIVFFFAFNWNGMHRFVKLGLVEFVLTTVILIALFSKLNELIKNILLLAASVLVGALFAVFGQIYQTSATALDFFLGWTAFIFVWVIVTNFALLWALFLYLINTYLVLYINSQMPRFSETNANLFMVVLNSGWLLLFLLLSKKYPYFKIPNWLKNLVFIAIVTIASIGIAESIFDKFNLSSGYLILVTVLIYTIGLFHTFKQKNLVFLAVIPFSLIFILSALWIKLLPKEWVYLVNAVFITIGSGYLIKYLIVFQKKWKDG
jgi:uncharacterized membrane protein